MLCFKCDDQKGGCYVQCKGVAVGGACKRLRVYVLMDDVMQ